MAKYGGFVFVDSIAKTYAYSHAEVFDLSWREVFTIIALGREQAYIEARATELTNMSKKAAKK